MAATSGEGGTTGTGSAIPISTPPIIAMTVLATVLIVMAQFPTTERLAAAMAWLIFVAVLLANGQAAFTTLANVTNVATSINKNVNDVKGSQG